MVKSSDEDRRRLKPATRLVRVGRDDDPAWPFVNPPVAHASTVLFDTVADYRSPKRYVYARRGNPTTNALTDALAELDGAAGAVICPSGLFAAFVALMSCVRAGDRILMVDTVYGPVRHLAMTTLAQFGVETVFFDPAVGGDIARLMTANTRAVYAEAPGSVTFEMLDLAAIADVAHRSGATVLFDNSWATPLYFRPIDHGADLSVMSATKYLAGHSDVILGTVSANEATWPRLKETAGNLGTHVGPDDAYLTLRGMRTLTVRLERHATSTIKVARWLQKRTEVTRVLYPALPDDPGHALWSRDFHGAAGLLSLTFDGWDDAKAAAFVDELSLFGIGVSWGGFESLAIVSHIEHSRSATQWTEGILVRLSIGLEDADDLIADLDRAFAQVSGR